MQNPANFAAFQDGKGNFQQFLPFFSTTGEGSFCVDVDLAKSGISGIQNGANVTLQFVFDGGDGQLYQVHLFPYLLHWRIDLTRASFT